MRSLVLKVPNDMAAILNFCPGWWAAVRPSWEAKDLGEGCIDVQYRSV